MIHTAPTDGCQLLHPVDGEVLDPDEPRRLESRERPPDVTATRTVPRLTAWAVVVGLSVGLLAVREPLALAPLALALAASIATALATSVPPGHGPERSRPFTLVAALPAGVILLVLGAVGVGLLGGGLGRPVWASGGLAILTVGAVLLATGLVSWRRSGRIVIVGTDWPALTGAGLLGAFFCWVVATQPFELWSRAMSTGTDFLRHLAMVRGVRDAGLLEPGVPMYPRTFHATIAWLSSALGLGEDSQTLWRATQPFVLLLLVVMLLAVMAITGRAAALILGTRWFAVAGAVMAGAAFVQTAWFSTFLGFGNVMNMVVALGLLAMLLTGIALGAQSATSALVAGGAVAATANAWQLVLPVAALGCLPWLLAFLRRGWRDPRQWAAWVGMGLLTLNGLAGVGATSAGAATSTITGSVSAPTVSNLFAPDWWWFAALGFSVVAAIAAFRQGARVWATSVIGVALGVVALTGYLLRATGSTWDLMLYYPVKAMWTGMVVLIPLAVVGGAVGISGVWRYAGSREGMARLVVQALIVGILGLVVAGTVGRGFAFRPHLVVMATGGAGMPNWSLAVIDAMENHAIPSEAREGALLMGVVPSTNVQGLAGGFVGMADYVAMESLSHLGMDEAGWAPVKSDLARRDTGRICSHLRAFPEALRITGPNRAAGPEWLTESGCPESVVQPQRWIVLDIDPVWFARSYWQDRDSWTYPTVAQYRAARVGA